MAARTVTLPTDKIGTEIGNYTIGFVTFRIENRVEDALCSGSGTLATLGKVRGVVTAAHVLAALPDEGEVGVVRLHGELIQYQRQTFQMGLATKVFVRGEKFGHDKPDLAFLRLPEVAAGWLEATNTFYNLAKHRDEYKADVLPAKDSVDAVVGLIDERTQTLPELGRLRRKGFMAFFSNGTISDVRQTNGYEFVDLHPTKYPDFRLPDNYQGTSGGALWKLYLAIKDDKPEIVGKRLWGVPFFQTRAPDGGITLTCQSASDVYGFLIDAIQKKWPDDASV